jgi:hypothetical protein
MVPRVWFKVMDAKLLEWCAGDLNKVNIDPRRRASFFAKYGVRDRSLSGVEALNDGVIALADIPVLDLNATGEQVAFDPAIHSAHEPTRVTDSRLRS